MSSHQLSEWIRYAELEPFGQPWENWLMSVRACQFASVHRSQDSAPPRPSDFFYESETDKKIRLARQTLNFRDYLKSQVKH